MSKIVYRIPQLLSSTKWTVVKMDEDGVNCMIDAFLHFPNVTSVDVFVEVETREGDVNVESGHRNLAKTSLPINTQLSMACSAPLSQCQDMNISEHHDVFHTSYVASINPIQASSINLDSNSINERENPLIRDILTDLSEDEGDLPDGDNSDTDLEETYHEEVNMQQQEVPPITSPQVLHQIPPFVAAVLESVFMPPCPQFSQVNWDVMSNGEEFHELVRRDTWRADEELFIGLKFPTKDAVQLALKHYSIKRHQNYSVEDLTHRG